MAERVSRRDRKKATNLSLRPELLSEARELGISISEAAEQGLKRAIADARERRWLERNRPAIESSNTHIETHGLPLARHRLF